jgi:hypothetical protein
LNDSIVPKRAMDVDRFMDYFAFGLPSTTRQLGWKEKEDKDFIL